MAAEPAQPIADNNQPEEGKKKINIPIPPGYKIVGVRGQGAEVTPRGNGVFDVKFNTNLPAESQIPEEAPIEENGVIPFPQTDQAETTEENQPIENVPETVPVAKNDVPEKPTEETEPKIPKEDNQAIGTAQPIQSIDNVPAPAPAPQTQIPKKSTVPHQPTNEPPTPTSTSTPVPETTPLAEERQKNESPDKTAPQNLPATPTATDGKNTNPNLNEAAAANDLRKQQSLSRRMRDAGENVKNLPRNLKDATLNKAGAIKSGAKNAANGISDFVRNPKQFAKNATSRAGTALANGTEKGLSNVQIKNKKAALRKKEDELRKDIEKIMGELGQKYNSIQGSFSMWLFSVMFPALYDQTNNIFNIGSTANLKIMVAKLKPKVAIMQTLKTTIEAATFAFAVLDAIIITGEMLAVSWYFIVTIFLAPIFFASALIIFYTLRCGQFSSLTKKILNQLNEQLPKMKEKLALAEKALKEQKELTETAKEESQTGLLETKAGKEGPKTEAGQNQPPTEQTEAEQPLQEAA